MAAGIQFAPSSDRKETLRQAEHLIKLAAGKGARIACLPQLFSTPWFPARIDSANFSFAESGDGPAFFLKSAFYFKSEKNLKEKRLDH